MQEKLTVRQLTLIGSMLFGLFFGAGNLIFPLILGARAGSALPVALLGMLVTAVGIPLLGVMSMGISRSEGLLDLAGRVPHLPAPLHLRPLPYHRASFRHSPVRRHQLHHRLFSLCGGQGHAVAGPLLRPLFWSGALFLPKTLQNSGLSG